MNNEKCIAIVAGTAEIHQPLQISLTASLEHPVYLLQASNQSELKQQLEEIAHNEIWLIPSNELTLNSIPSIIESDALSSKQINIPGTAYIERAYSAKELSNKSTLFNLLKEYHFKYFNLVDTQIVSFQNVYDLFKLKDLNFPILIKPVAKDCNDSFTQTFPSKVLVVESLTELAEVSEIHISFFNRSLMLQEVVQGTNISWCGYACAGEVYGHSITAITKSPTNQIGGTTTLAKLEASKPNLTAAVQEIAEALSLDGIFEIEFICQAETLYFFYEINPRPWLQVALLLQESNNIFTKYFRQKGFQTSYLERSPSGLRKFWGSATRYLQLQNRNISWSILIKTISYDVYYSRFFNTRQKVWYSLHLLFLLVKKQLRSFRA